MDTVIWELTWGGERGGLDGGGEGEKNQEQL